MSTPDPLECPNCHADVAQVRTEQFESGDLPFNPDDKFVECRRCGKRTGRHETVTKAVLSWNATDIMFTPNDVRRMRGDDS